MILATFVALTACDARSASPDRALPTHEESPTPADHALHQTEEAIQPGEPVVIVTDPEVMKALEQRGLSLANHLGHPGESGSLRELSASPVLVGLIEVLEADLAEFRSADPRLGVGVAGFAHRLFDPTWLRATTTFFELVAVVNRIDRRPFVEGACGEVRLVYRLAYETTAGEYVVSSRLPMTMTMDWLAEAPDQGDCSHVARRWHRPRGISNGELVDWLVSDDGPLSPSGLGRESLHRVQVNLQSVRWPSTVQPTLAGHAEYVLRSFVPDDQGMLSVERLENTPDVERIEADEELRAELLDWLARPETLERIDEGTALLPERFLAERAVSVAPRGLARRANRPFGELLHEADLETLDFSGLDQVRSAPGLVRRLDDMSCAGCHQGRALAGFHLLGEDSQETFHANALAVPFSAHAIDEVLRRHTLLAAIEAGDTVSYARPFSERDHRRPGAYGTPCGLSDDLTFAAWDCQDDLVCTPYDLSRHGGHVGICLPEVASVGDPCETGRVNSRRDPHDDRIVQAQRSDCGPQMVCNTNRVGFPGGMCTSSCSAPGADGRCGAIAVLDPFNQCLARENPFEQCLSQHVNPAGLRACDEESPCRHDYICARNEDAQGVCIPPYFLFQMRVDGHR